MLCAYLFFAKKKRKALVNTGASSSAIPNELFEKNTEGLIDDF